MNFHEPAKYAALHFSAWSGDADMLAQVYRESPAVTSGNAVKGVVIAATSDPSQPGMRKRYYALQPLGVWVQRGSLTLSPSPACSGVSAETAASLTSDAETRPCQHEEQPMSLVTAPPAAPLAAGPGTEPYVAPCTPEQLSPAIGLLTCSTARPAPMDPYANPYPSLAELPVIPPLPATTPATSTTISQFPQGALNPVCPISPVCPAPQPPSPGDFSWPAVANPAMQEHETPFCAWLPPTAPQVFRRSSGVVTTESLPAVSLPAPPAAPVQLCTSQPTSLTGMGCHHHHHHQQHESYTPYQPPPVATFRAWLPHSPSQAAPQPQGLAPVSPPLADSLSVGSAAGPSAGREEVGLYMGLWRQWSMEGGDLDLDLGLGFPDLMEVDQGEEGEELTSVTSLPGSLPGSLQLEPWMVSL